MSDSGIRAGRLSDEQITDNYADLNPPLDGHQAAVEAARCLFCHDAPCAEACPTDIDIPGFIRKISTGNVMGSARTILEENIMGGTCANVCPVEELCEAVCVRTTAGEDPVVIGRLQRYATDHLFAAGIQPFSRQKDTNRRVAVIGAGPAGLSCAHRLAMLGHRVDVFEAKDKAGGLNEYGLAAYKMLDERAAKEVRFILDIGGITLKNNKILGNNLSLSELRQSYDAVFLGLGHNAVNDLGLGDEPAGVHNAVDFIERIRQENRTELPIGNDVVVVGGGNTAIDIAVQVKKLGAENVTLVYRRGIAQMGATEHEQEIAQLNGVLIRTWASPVGFEHRNGSLSAVRFARTELDDDGRLKPLETGYTLAADQLFKAIGQKFSAASLGDNDFPELDGARIRVDEHRRTSLPDVWAGGDCVAGVDLTVVAVQDGKLAALDIHRALSADQEGVNHG